MEKVRVERVHHHRYAEVLNEEVADTAIGLLLCTVREFPQSERFLRAGKWPRGQYPLTKATFGERTVGMVGMGRIGKAIARRLEAFGVPVVYHSRNPQSGVTYKYYPKLLDMARDVDTLMVIVPGGASTQNMINADVLKALGPRGVVINMARGSVIDEPALIEALKNRTIYSAGLDVFAKEPHVPEENDGEWITLCCFPISARRRGHTCGDGSACGR